MQETICVHWWAHDRTDIVAMVVPLLLPAPCKLCAAPINFLHDVHVLDALDLSLAT
jgi:hypothetical protein